MAFGLSAGVLQQDYGTAQLLRAGRRRAQKGPDEARRPASAGLRTPVVL